MQGTCFGEDSESVAAEGEGESRSGGSRDGGEGDYDAAAQVLREAYEAGDRGGFHGGSWSPTTAPAKEAAKNRSEKTRRKSRIVQFLDSSDLICDRKLIFLSFLFALPWIQSLHPGFYLSEVTLDAYKVPEETKV